MDKLMSTVKHALRLDDHLTKADQAHAIILCCEKKEIGCISQDPMENADMLRDAMHAPHLSEKPASSNASLVDA